MVTTTRASGVRGLALRAAQALRWLVVAAAVVLLGLTAAPAAHAVPATDLVVEDDAGVLYLPQLESAVAGLDFYEPTTVAVYTRRGEASDNLNEVVLAFARAEHPEWITADGQKWADGLFLIALDPDGRQVGTYFGEDRKVSLDQQEEIQEATKDAYREARWTDGTIDGIAKAADLMNRPWYRSPALYIAGAAAAVIGLGALGTAKAVRAGRRRLFAELLERGEASYASVTTDLEATELNARTVPEDSAYGRLLLEKFSGFEERHSEATRMHQDLLGLGKRARSRKEAVRKAERFEELALSLDGLDDAIAQANDLLNMSNHWRKAWRAQTAGLREDLDGIPQLLAGAGTDAASARALRLFAEGARERLEACGAGLADRTLTPDQALDAVRRAREELTGLLAAHADTVVEAATRSKQEADLMRAELEKAREQERLRTRSHGTIIDVGYPNLGGRGVIAYSAGFSSGRSAVEEARTSASSSPSTGYGSSGGSFSGSGSSSRF
ncbi:hypothetical protein GCM10023081_31200 [Arthrobacter ginkgonis]|uniref:DUF5129 domain-containing protein n=1 Tax=Arthrobacter ginkgonis TaxID=1630594 RepID=A0ABP7CJ07_9MICC